MVYLVIEEYGHYYESGYTNMLGYSHSLEEAEVLKLSLEKAYELYQNTLDKVNEEDDRLYSLLPEDATEKQYEELCKVPLQEFRDSLGLTNSCGYEYDYYWVAIKEVKEINASNSN